MGRKPRAVQQAAEAAARMHQETYPGETQELPAEPAQEPAQEPGAPVVELVQPAPEEPAEPAAEPAAEPEAPAEPVRDAAYWEHRYKTTNGELRASNQRHDEQMRNLQDQLATTQQILANLHAAPKPEPAQETPEPTAKRLVEPDEVEDYGAELLDVVGRRAQEVFSPELGKLAERVAHIEQHMGGVERQVQQTSHDRVASYLDQKVPDWQKLNHDQEFLSWLAQVDPFSGQRRQDLLTRAYQRSDAERVALFFTTYLQENAAVQPPPAPPTPAPQEQTKQGKVPMQQLVAPGKPREGTPSVDAQGDKRIYSQQEIAQFYADVTAGRYRNNPELRVAHEKAIHDAVVDGRVGE